jgi:serine/threonine protein kinase
LLPEYKLWTIFAQITDALAYIHSKRIIHRDLKPANVLMMADETIKLADFGLGRLLKEGETSAKSNCGTPYYMAPERIKEQPYKFKSDIWSAGCILYEVEN